MNVTRGFRRLAWVAIGLILPAVAVVAYESSEHVSRYEALLLDADFPELDSAIKSPIEIADVGIAWIPFDVAYNDVAPLIKDLGTKAAADRQTADLASIKEMAASYRKETGETDTYSAVDDVRLVKRMVTALPELRPEVAFREYEIRAVRAKRPGLAALVTAATMLGVTIVLQGAISIVAWVARGFSGPEE